MGGEILTAGEARDSETKRSIRTAVRAHCRANERNACLCTHRGLRSGIMTVEDNKKHITGYGGVGRQPVTM